MYNKHAFVLVALLTFNVARTQVVNYVNNPGFELTSPSVSLSPYDAVKFWGSIDTAQGSTYLLSALSSNANNAPYSQFGFQYPKTGNNFILSSFFCTACARWNPRNRLKQALKANTTYCGRYFVVNTNNNRIAIENYSMFFGSSTMDSITKCAIPLTYLNPQIQYTNGIISDTLNWIPITGTFVAAGDEKYMVLGNFKSNAATNTLLINTPLQTMSNDVYIDDVSLIELDLPAFAGRDTFFLPGGSVFIGREPDVGIDEACMWYKLPDMTNAIDTVAGLWVTPVGTTTYVVRQQLWCSGVKWDTVVVHESALGLSESPFDSAQDDLRVYPVPAGEYLELIFTGEASIDRFNAMAILNSLGQVIRDEEISFKNNKVILKTGDLPDGCYVLQLKSVSSGTVSKHFVVSH